MQSVSKPSRVSAIVLLLLLCLAPLRAQAPVNPHASPEARALLNFLYSISGHYTLAGQHNYPNTIAQWTDRAYDFTGKYPAVFGQDFGFQGGDDKDSTRARPAVVEEAIRQYRNGAIVTFTWHAVRPTDNEPVTFRDSVQGHLSDFEFHELLTPGTDLYKRWCAQVDVIAGYLKQLRDARVPVLWRPYHEVNGNWFWWGGRKGPQGSAALYRQLFDRFVNYHHLDNLIWVWNANSPGADGKGPGPYADYFPGLQYADVLSVDVYGEFKQSYYDDLLALAAGKPIALGEVGGVPSPAILQQQPKYTWFMTWSEFIEMYNPLEAVRAIYDAPDVLTRDDPRLSQAMAAIRQASAPPQPQLVTPEPTEAARELLARLYHASGQDILSGQENDAKSASGATQQVFEATGKYPAIYAADLGEGAPQAIADEARKQHQEHAIVSLSWRPVSPTSDPSGPWDAGVDSKLSDFEWHELLTPGTRLFSLWCAQVDTAARYLSQLQQAGVPVLWRPYPDSNGARFWWAGRKTQSAALYRQLFDRLVNVHNLRNVVWVWEAPPPSFGPNSPGRYSDFFPGLGYVDALQADLGRSPFSWRSDRELSRFGVGKVVGLELEGWLPDAAMLQQASQWAWFLAQPSAAPPDQLHALYASPRVVSR